MTKQEVNKIINTIILTLEHKKDQFVEDMKNINDDLFDESLLKETTEPIYDYIVEKIYQTPSTQKKNHLKNKRKLKRTFNKFYAAPINNRYRDIKNIKMKPMCFKDFAFKCNK